ncbi:RDD family protein [Rheinheimera maricola]|uniref:RDD family protein n=1 Tax=Rheinheimera maricola TaxID=2793282 RepID=A0ABS7XAS6_9GAMM|nr:RDD family protein [Rheinheimera maricola]MBZ9612637.1 RDD family protein [Rheinheimera maricola]
MSLHQFDGNAGITEVSPGVYIDLNGVQLTPQQVRQVVTPHDFTVANALVGRPLAKPWRRAMAITLDGVVIALLTSGSFLFLLPVAAYLALRCHMQQNNRRRNTVITIAILALFLLPLAPQKADERSDYKVKAGLLITASAIALTNTDCNAQCADKQLDNISEQLRGSKLTDDEIDSMVRDLLEESILTPAEQQAALDKVMRNIKQHRQQAAGQATDQLIQATTQPETNISWWQKLAQSDHSVLKWLQGILTDLGIGFGWAVFYFTLFISWNGGQTIGKAFMAIKVVQLNNTPLSLWQAFGRQGGYSAGFATGLLGFIQIYWDPNRQAIQDKVADTLVLKI